MKCEINPSENALRQQSVIARFGELALRCDDLDEILTEACRLISEALGTDLAKVMELQEDQITLLVRAGVGWKPNVVGIIRVEANRSSSEGYALHTGKPITSDDIQNETRFRYAQFLTDNGVKALVNVPVFSKTATPYGILQVDSRVPRNFGDVEISFLRGYANVLGAAVDRLRRSEELRVTQAKLQAQEAILHQSSRLEALGHLTGGVAHDFNNLLTIIGSSADLLRRHDLNQERRTRYVLAISDTVDRAAKLTGQLLAFARRQTLDPEAFDVGKQVENVIDLLSSLLGSRVRISQELGENPCYATADISQFETALVNLATNAQDAMGGAGCIAFNVRVVSSIPAVRGHAGSPGNFVAISVSDTGQGIEAANISKVFEPFFTTKEVGKGTGLGLSQVFGFAKQSNGEIDVESVLGKGTTFTLFLPHCHLAETSPPRQAAQREQRSEGSTNFILVVEDNHVVGQFATEMLHDLGYQTSWASNAHEALAVLSKGEQPIDLVFSDVIMPGMNGVDFAIELGRLYPKLPVVLTSGYSNVLADEGTHGFDLIPKPYSIEALSAVLDRKLGAYSNEREDMVTVPIL